MKLNNLNIILRFFFNYILINFYFVANKYLFYFDLLLINFIFLFFFYQGLVINIFNTIWGDCSIVILIFWFVYLIILSSKKSSLKESKQSLYYNKHKIKILKEIKKTLEIRQNFVRSLIVTILIFIDMLVLLCFFEISSLNSQFVFSVFGDNHTALNNSQIKIYFGIDRLSVIFLLLTIYTFPVCILANWNSIDKMQKLHNQCFLVLEVFILLCFCVSDALSFYIFFEATLIPMIIILGFWGGSERKIKAINIFWGYALLGSAPILIGILVLFTISGCVEFGFLLHKVHIRSDIELFLFFCFFFGFSVKVPMFPFHSWLPEVHVEAPTAGSVILSGVLLKLGLYGIIRFCIILLPGAIPFFISFIQLLCIISIILASLMCIKQYDFKKVIAYSSIVHMNIVIIGIFSGSTLTIGFLGSLISGITHCFASGSLFLLAGFLYERIKIREFPSIQGLYTTMPIYAFFLLLSALANSAFPGTFNFIGEIIMIYGIFASNTILGLLAVLLTSLHVIYNILIFVKLSFGQTNSIKSMPQDLNLREITCLFLFLFWIYIFGLVPFIVISDINWLWIFRY